MPLVPGTRLGPYEIVGAIGAGGMGEVYRGRDTRLDRTVALKVLPDAVATDPERLARFEREAKTLAALNHPNIAQIYGFEQGALAMEFVEGEDLATLIARGDRTPEVESPGSRPRDMNGRQARGGGAPRGLNIDDAIAIARHIAFALEAAHEFGIIHRDLKPSNIRVRPDGVVKVLDFGLAKALASPMDMAMATSLPTITSPAMTGLGTILGTALYMSPEQAGGKAVDKRSDIWAFGAVLYEMVTGRRAFDGETVSEVLAGVIRGEPDWSIVPPRLRRLLGTCLEKDPKKRLRDIGDWTRELDVPPASVQPARTFGLWLAWATAAILLAATLWLSWMHFGQSAVVQTLRFQIPAPEGTFFDAAPVVSPDGRSVVFITRDDKGQTRLWIRNFDELEARPLAGTEGGRSPSWKPDGQFIAFAHGRAVKRIPAGGGPVDTICEVGSAAALGTIAWSKLGVLVIGGTTAGVIRRVAESGGDVTAITALNRDLQEVVHGIPALLPDGRHFLYFRSSRAVENSGVSIGSIDRKPEEQARELLLPTSWRVTFVPTSEGGRLLYLQEGTLLARPFDPDRRTFTGEPVRVAEGIGNSGAGAFFSASPTALAYRTGAVVGAGRASQLTWMDRFGKALGTVGEPTSQLAVEISPDGSRAAVTRVPTLSGDIWMIELTRGTATRLTTSPGNERYAAWSPDGARVVYQASRDQRSDLYGMAANGSGNEDLVFKSDVSKAPTSWSRDGRFLLFQSMHPQNGSDVWLLPLEGDRKPIPIATSSFTEQFGRFSPDGRWISYTSNVTGRPEVYVRPFDPSSPGSSAGGFVKVSKDGGHSARWRRDSKELFFEARDGTLMAVDVSGSPQFRPGVPRALFRVPTDAPWDVAPDGQRFLVAMPWTEQGRSPITVVLNWFAGK